jgi:endonuclease-3 related protein
MGLSLKVVYNKLYEFFGPQRWWPADSAFEVMIGAILTQNTSWANVEKAIANLRENKLLEASKLYRLPESRLASLIRSAGYYNVKTKRLKSFLEFFIKDYKADHRKMARVDTFALREKLLSVKGIGPETADSILLYALDKPIFVVDAYTKRIFARHKVIKDGEDYAMVQQIFMKGLPEDAGLFNEYHALLVRLGKEYCLKSNPKCSLCPLN